MNNKTLIYIDPGFLVNIGHFTRMGEIIKKEATASNIRLHHHVGPEVPAETASNLGLMRGFSYRAGLQWIEEPEEALRDFHVRLDEILHDLSTKEPDSPYKLFMYTAHPLHLPIIAYLLNKHHFEIPDLSAHICLFYLDPQFLLSGGDGAEEYKSMLKRASRLTELFDPINMVTVCTDSQRTARLYGPYFKRKLKVLSLPVETISNISFRSKVGTDEKITIGYIAQATQRTGYDLVYHAYKRLSTMEVFDKVKFKIKHTRRESLSHIHNLFLSESKNIFHVNDFLPNAAYENFFSDCDIILIPYSRKYYPCQTSGIVVEAIFRNKVVIVPQDTWMSDQIQSWGSGETFVSGDLESFVQTMVKVVSNFDYYKKRTTRNIDEYRNLHSCANLFAELGLKEAITKKTNHTDHVERNLSNPLIKDLLIENVVLMCEKEQLIRQKLRDRKELMKRDNEIKKRIARIRKMEDSYSWRITAPLRWPFKEKNNK